MRFRTIFPKKKFKIYAFFLIFAYNYTMFTKNNNRLIINDEFGTVWIEPWGTNSVRVRMTADRAMDENDWALIPVKSVSQCETDRAGGKNETLLEERTTCTPLGCSIEILDVDTTFPWAEHFPNVEKTTGQISPHQQDH